MDKPSRRIWRTVSPAFVLRPNWEPAAAPRTWPVGLLLLWAMGLAGSFALVPLVRLVTEGRFVSELNEEINEALGEGQVWVLALIVVVSAPLAEEFIFRFPLTHNARPGMVAASLVGGAIWLGVLTQSWVGAPFGVAAIIFGALALELRKGRVSFEWWRRRPRIAIYVSVVAFGFVHGPNYTTDGLLNWLWLPVLVSPQLWIGLMFVIARVRYGFGVAFAHHAIHNGLVFVFIVATTDY